MNLLKFSLLLVALFTLKLFAGADPCPCGLSSYQDIETTNGIRPGPLVFSPDSSCLIVVNRGTADQNDSSIQLYTVTDCELTPNGDPISLESGVLSDVALSPDGTCLVVTDRTNSELRIFSLNNCHLEELPNSPLDLSPATGPTAVAFSPTGNCLAITFAGEPGTIRLYSVDGCQITESDGPLNTGTDPVDVIFSPNGNCVAAVSESDDISIYSVNNCQLTFIESYSGGLDLPTSVAFSPNGSCIVVPSPDLNEIVVFNVINGCQLVTPPSTFPTGDGPSSAIFSPNGKCLAHVNNDDNSVTIFSVNGCQLENRQDFALSGEGNNVQRLVYSPNNKFLAITQQNGFVRIIRTNFVTNPVVSRAYVGCDGCVNIAGIADASCSGTEISPDGYQTTISVLENGNPLVENLPTDSNGNFNTQVCFEGGQHTLDVIATNSVGCSATTKLSVTFSDNF